MHKAELWVQSSHADCTLESFDWSKLPLVQTVVNEYLQDVERKHGLLFIGDPGLGKTHILVGLFKWLLDSGLSVGSDITYVQWSDLVSELRGIFSKEKSPEEALARITNVKYLLIDDIRPCTGVFWNTCLKLIIEQVYVKETKLIMTANIEDADNLVSLWQVEDYYVSRLQEIVQIIKLKGTDHRKLR